MATYFVKTGGSDGANGLSDANAWATVGKVNGSSFTAGDIIQFRRGDTWREQLTIPSAGSSGNVITFTHYGSAQNAPTLNGADLMTSWSLDSGNVWKATLNSQPAVVVFEDQVGIEVASKAAIDQPTEWFWETNLLYTYGTTNPTNTYKTIEAAVRPTDNEAIININGKNYITIDGVDVRISNDVGIKNYAGTASQTGRTIRNCKVTYCADGGICLYADSFTHTSVLIELNELGWLNLRGNADGSGALEGITLMHADGFEIGYNTVHHVGEEGIDSHGQSSNGRIHHNRVHTYIGTADFRPLIYVDGATNVEVDHNVAFGHSSHNGKGYQLNCENAAHSSDNVNFHHNLGYDVGTGWELNNTGGGTGHANVKFDHNTLYQCGFVGVYFNSDILNKLSGTNRMRNNIFDTSVNNDIRDDSTGNYGISNFTIDNNFFVTSNPSETQGTNAVVAASPLFKNPAQGNFQLLRTSPCRNTAAVIAGVNDGYAEGAPDIGAFEYTAALFRG